MKENFDVTGMSCSACSSHVEKSVNRLDGVTKVSVNLLTNSMQVEFEEKITDAGTIIKAVEDAGYGANVKQEHGTSGAAKEKNAKKQTAKEDSVLAMKKRLIFSIVFWIPLMYVSMGHMIYEALGIAGPVFEQNYLYGNENAVTYAFTQILLLVPILIANQKYFKNGFKTLAKKAPNMDTLVALGATAAIVYGIVAIYRIGYGLGHGNMMLVMQYRHDLYFESAGTILTLITVGKYLETKSKGKTSEAITKLMNLAPKTVTVVRDGKETTIPAADVMPGDIFLIRPGEAVAVDGIVLEGESAFDESAITGESMPVEKKAGDKLVSASINKAGFIRAKATRVGEDTTIEQIIRLVEEASSSKAPIARLADKIAGIFVPVVISIAVVTAIVWLLCGMGVEAALSSAIAVLVISCPCALGLATPVAIMVGTGKGAENGILIKSGEALETAHLIDTVVLDKTGTITEGRPVVTDVKLFAGTSEDELLEAAGSLEKGSEHPLAEAVVKYCEEKGTVIQAADQFEAVFGKGIRGKIGGNLYFAGNEKMMEEAGIPLSEDQKAQILEFAGEGKTPLLFAKEHMLIGILAVADVVKATSREAIGALRETGICTIMLTGDNEVTARAIQKEVGADEVIAGVLPAQKEEKVAMLKEGGHKVAMVGDGINDAPALARADVGIAIGAGTDVAIESADVVLMKNDLYDVVRAIRLSKAVIRNIKENLFWAFFYNSIGIPLAAGVLYPAFGIKLNPMFGAAAMSLSSICVVSNALRLKGVKLLTNKKPEREPERKEEKGVKETTINIEGMMCSHCTGTVEKKLAGIAGVKEVTVSLENKNAVVKADDSVTAEILKAAVTDAGYEVTGIQ